ncbi:hypothetical protein LQZ18_08800 [Lachnospiraceae bacterium ZAX-1]
MELDQYCMYENGIEEDGVLRMFAPYSAILEKERDRTVLYKQMYKNPERIHELLADQTAQIKNRIYEALQDGGTIISIADPYANPNVVGEKNTIEFAEKYLFSLLRDMKAETFRYGQRLKENGSVLHLCPRSSALLEKHGFLESRITSIEQQNYKEFLCGLAKKAGFYLLGHQCIHTVLTDRYYSLCEKVNAAGEGFASISTDR